MSVWLPTRQHQRRGAYAAATTTTTTTTTRLYPSWIPLVFLLFVLTTTTTPLVEALPQDLALDVTLQREATTTTTTTTTSRFTMYASVALFGPLPRMTAAANDAGTIVLPPEENPLMCHNTTTTTTTTTTVLPPDSILLVPRGVCTFQRKVYHAQVLGAKAVLIYGTLASRYSLNETNHEDHNAYTTNDIVFPTNLSDYDCSKGQAYIDSAALSLDPLPYNAAHNDPLLSGTDTNNLCRAAAASQSQSKQHFDTTCPSQACLLTGETTKSGNDNNDNNDSDKDDLYYRACCAWDLHIYLYGDHNNEQAIHIPAAYLTMQQGRQLLAALRDNDDDDHQTVMTAVLYARWRPVYNISSALLWALGVAACALAAWLSATEYHQYTARCMARRSRQQQQDGSNGQQQSSSSRRLEHQQQAPIQEELTVWHAAAFVVMASTSLLVLFYFKIYAVVKVMYAAGCSKAVATILVDPVLRRFQRRWGWKNAVLYRSDADEDLGDITTRDVVSHGIAYAWGVAWLVTALAVRHADRLAFFWVTQNVFGVCMCVLFMQVIKLNSLKVAAALLIVAFLYDIFFVFLSPYVFQKSVMIDVATSGGPPTADPLWCEKYPDDKGCQGGDPLPMLLTMPRLFDYQGGSNLLGLGDIVLPGLLVSYAARFDAAKSLLGVMRGGNGSVVNDCPERKYCFHCNLCSGGYFWPLVVAYGIGLSMANAAVYLMRMGQPALLYLVPCCLGTFCVLAWKRGELADLWDSPKAIRAADTILYGEDYATTGGSSTHHAAILAEEGSGLEAPMVPSAQDLDEDENDAVQQGTMT